MSTTTKLAIAACLLLVHALHAVHAQQAPTTALKLTPGAPPASDALVRELSLLDRRLFDAVFGCDVDTLATLVADDFEFLHDKWGMTARSGPAFVAAIREGCARQASGQDFRARRELDAGSMQVHVLNGYGAMQMGSHRFYAMQPGQPDRLTESGRFIDVWKREGDAWKLARVISYDHRLAAD